MATGKSQRGARGVLTRHRLLSHFATIQTADDAPSKPHPGMVMAAMQAAGAAPSDTCVVGDTTYDIEMAIAAGATPIGVSWGYHRAAQLRAAGAIVVIDRFPDLIRTLERAWRISPSAIPSAQSAQGSRTDARHLRGHLQERSARSDGVGAAQHAPCFAQALLSDGVGRATRGRLAHPARRQAGAHARAARARCAVARTRAGHRRRMAGASRRDRSGDDAADAACQFHHRRRGGCGRRGRGRDREISRLRSSFAIAPKNRRRWSRRQAEALDPVLAWARDALGARFVLAEGVVHVAQPPEAIAAAGAGDPARSLAARRRACGDHAHRLGAAWRSRCRRARCRPTRSGRPRMSTRISRCSNGAATSARSSGAPIAMPRCGRRRTC